jgi:hypothetical protein
VNGMGELIAVGAYGAVDGVGKPRAVARVAALSAASAEPS